MTDGDPRAALAAALVLGALIGVVATLFVQSRNSQPDVGIVTRGTRRG